VWDEKQDVSMNDEAIERNGCAQIMTANL